MKLGSNIGRMIVVLTVTWLLLFESCPLACAAPATTATTHIVPKELPDAVLHNPDMGWVLYENYPLDQDPHGSATLLQVPQENFEGVDSVAVMFSWQDVERSPGVYDFSAVDYAYEYWAKRGKAIQLRLSTESLLWWSKRQPPTGTGVPDDVLATLPANDKQTRDLEGQSYVVVNANNTFYLERLRKFLRAVAVHFDNRRPVTLIDLRGFGVWGEWHSGFRYTSVEQRRAALKGIIDAWSDSLPHQRLALSYSYDPDSPPQFYEGATDKFYVEATGHYAEYLRYSAFDYGLTKPNITWRRDGCGGAVHSNERKLNEEAFRLGRGPMFSEFVDGYTRSKAGGSKWLEWKINDALSLHPNYISLLGWQGGDSLSFVKEGAEWFCSALRRMGYRLLPTHVDVPVNLNVGVPFSIEVQWVNRGVGRALRDYEQRLYLVSDDGRIAAQATCGAIATSKWVAGEKYETSTSATFSGIRPAMYKLAIGLHDHYSGRNIALPIEGNADEKTYIIGKVSVNAGSSSADSVK